MDVSKMLCSSPESEEGENVASTPVRSDASQALTCSTEIQVAKFSVIPDNKRKRTYKLSAAQRQQRHEHEAYESRVYNLTLDIISIRQQIQQLLEYRDVHITRLILDGQRFEGDVLQLAWNLLDGVRNGEIGFTPKVREFFNSRTHISQQDPEASGGVHQFVLQCGPSPFAQTTFIVKSIRVVAVVDSTTPGECAREIRRVCGNAGGCVVEVLTSPTGWFTRDTVASLFPHILSNESLVSTIVGQRITFPSRLLLYFSTQRRLMQQVVQTDLIAALDALHIGEPGDFAALADVGGG